MENNNNKVIQWKKIIKNNFIQLRIYQNIVFLKKLDSITQ